MLHNSRVVCLKTIGSVCFWIIRGFNGPNKQDVIKDILRQNKFEVLGLLKTIVASLKVGEMKAKIGHWEVVTNATSA